MSLSMLWRRLIQRPFVLMIILGLAALAGYAVWTNEDLQAESRTAVLVVPPWSFETEIFPNPVLNLGERTTQLASAMVIAVQSNDVRNFVGQTGSTYKVSNLGDNLRDPRPSAVIQFVVTGPNQQAAHDAAGRLIVKSRQILADMQYQAGVGDSPDMAQLQVILQPEETVAFGTSQIRAAAAAGVAVFIVGILLFWGIESILGRRRRRRRSRSRDRGEYQLERRDEESPNSDGPDEPAQMPPARQPT